MKKTLARLSLTAVLVLSISACGAKEEVKETASVTEASAPVQETETAAETATEQTAGGNITALSFTSNDDLELVVGKRDITTHLELEIVDKSAFSPSDVIFVSTNPEVATITFEKVSRNNNLYFAIDALSAGETEVYAVTADGSVESAHKKVVVAGR